MDSKILRMLYGGVTTPIDFCYENLSAPPLLCLLSEYDIDQLRQTAMSVSLSGDINTKYRIMDSVMKNRNFRRLAAGTNRIVYRHLEYSNIVIKVAVDQEGIKNNPDEFANQQFIKPFCCKVFEVSPCGTVGIFERVDRITSRYEFVSIAEDIFDMISNKLVGKYVLEDIGTKFMYNWGIRRGFGPVLLDFPYVYELDGSKIYCTTKLDNGTICGGEIDYDKGFNFLMCKKCGCIHRARDLSKPRKESGLFIHAKKKGDIKMKIAYKRGEEVIKVVEKKDEVQFIKQAEARYKKKPVTEDTIIELPVAVATRERRKIGELRKEYRENQRMAKKPVDIDAKLGKFTGRYVQVQSEINSVVKAEREPSPSGVEKAVRKLEDSVKETVIPDVVENKAVETETWKDEQAVTETKEEAVDSVVEENKATDFPKAEYVSDMDEHGETVSNTTSDVKSFEKWSVEPYNPTGSMKIIKPEDDQTQAISFGDEEEANSEVSAWDKHVQFWADSENSWNKAEPEQDTPDTSMEVSEELSPEVPEQEEESADTEDDGSGPIKIGLSKAMHRRSTRFSPEFYELKGEDK